MNLFSHGKISIIALDGSESFHLEKSHEQLSNCWRFMAESYDMIYNEGLIRVKLSHKTQPAHTDIGQT